MLTTEEVDLLGEMKAGLTDFKQIITKDVNEKLKAHALEVSREIKQRTARGPQGIGLGTGDGRDPGVSTRPLLLADSNDFKTWLAGPRSSRSSFVTEIQLPPTDRKATILNAGPTTYMPGVQGPAQPALRVAELMPNIPVQMGAAVSWTKETAFTAAAGVVPEGQLKPTSDLAFQNIITPFSTIATITKASVQSLADVPTLMAWIDARLAYAVRLKEEAVLLNDATSGLVAAASPLDPAYAPATGATPLDVVGAALGQLSAAGFSPDGIVLSGADVNKARLLKSTTGEYIWASPDSLLGTAAMWGVLVCIAPALAPGTFLVGAFGEATIRFSRQSLVVEISYENEDDFVRNLATIRAELRSALAIPVPAGLVGGSLTVAAANASKTSK